MRAPAPGIHARVASEEGEEICGKFIPAGTGVGTNVSAMLLNPNLFGADAAIFRPERFLEAEKLGGAASRLRMERDVELVFGYGRWQCAGKTVAFMELSKIYFEVRTLQFSPSWRQTKGPSQLPLTRPLSST
jgi:cytochrome P450